MGRNLRTAKLSGVYSTDELFPFRVLLCSLLVFSLVSSNYRMVQKEKRFLGTYIGSLKKNWTYIVNYDIYSELSLQTTTYDLISGSMFSIHNVKMCDKQFFVATIQKNVWKL